MDNPQRRQERFHTALELAEIKTRTCSQRANGELRLDLETDWGATPAGEWLAALDVTLS